MNDNTLQIAMMEAKHFLRAAAAYQERIKTGWIGGCKEGGAVRRSSMDLTRALAQLRKP